MEKLPNSSENLKPRASRFLETNLSVKPFRDPSNIKVKLTLWSVLHVTDVAVQSNGLQLIGDINFSSKNIANIQLKLEGGKGDIRFTLTLSDASTMELSLFAVKGEKYVYVTEYSYDRAIDLQKINELSQVDYLRYKFPEIFVQQTQDIPKISTRNINTNQIFLLRGRIMWEDYRGNIHDLMGCRYNVFTTTIPFNLEYVDKNGNAVDGIYYTDEHGRYDMYIKCYPFIMILFYLSLETRNARVTPFKDGSGYIFSLYNGNIYHFCETDNNFVIRDTYKNEKHASSIPAGYTDLNSSNWGIESAALQITQALYFGFQYVEEMDEGNQLQQTQIFFPWNINADDGNHCYTNGNNMYISDNAYKAWDIILHEFGHVIQNLYDIKRSPGGDHFYGHDDIEDRGKSDGIALAWGEAWPTVFAIRITQYFKDRYNLQDYPFIADDSYNSNYGANNSWWSYSLENPSQHLYGEGCEDNIIGALYDMIDKTGKKPNGNLPLTDKEFWDLLMKSKAKIFRQFMFYVYKIFGTDNHMLSKILMTNGLAPRDIKIKNDTLSYTVPGKVDCVESLHDESHVRLFISSSDKPFYKVTISTKGTNQASCIMPMMLLYTSNISGFYAQIYSYQNSQPRTGPYYSLEYLYLPRLFGGMYSIFPYDFKFVTDRGGRCRVNTYEGQQFMLDAFNMLYQNPKVLVSDPEKVGYSKLTIKTTNPMIRSVSFFLKINKETPNTILNPNNKIEVGYRDDAAKEHIVWYKTLTHFSKSTTQTNFFTVDFDEIQVKEVVFIFRNFAQLGSYAAINGELGNIIINYNLPLLSHYPMTGTYYT